MDSQTANLHINENGDYNMNNHSKISLQQHSGSFQHQSQAVSFSKKFPKFVTVGTSRIFKQNVNEDAVRNSSITT